MTFFGPGQFVPPDNEADAQQAIEDWMAHKEELGKWFRRRSEKRSADDNYIERMIKAFWNIYCNYRRGLREAPASRKSPVHKVEVAPSTDGEPVHSLRPNPSWRERSPRTVDGVMTCEAGCERSRVGPVRPPAEPRRRSTQFRVDKLHPDGFEIWTHQELLKSIRGPAAGTGSH